MIEDNREYYENHHYEHKSHWLRTLACILSTLLGAFLAFYLVTDMTYKRLMDPAYQMRRMEKIMKTEQKRMEHFEKRFGDNPFEPRMTSTLVNLVKEPGEYKVIVDLKPLGENEKNVNVKLADNIVTVSGEVERKEHRREDILNFSQSYYLDEKLIQNKMTKEKKGNKYIITIPYED